MSDFDELQARFGAALMARSLGDADVAIFAGDAQRARCRLGLYRGNVQANAEKALANAFPICRMLVGEDFFRGIAAAYASRVPSRSGDLNEYGAAFAKFVADFAPAHELSYLPDVAHLEWQVHLAHYAADAPRFDPGSLLGVSEAEFGERGVRLHSACAIVASRWPLARIFEIHQPDYAGAFAVDLDAGGGPVLVYRPEFRVRVRPLTAGDARFLDAARERMTVAQALDAARAVDPEFALDVALRTWIADRVIVDLAVAA